MGAELTLAAIPFYDGAVRLAAEGVRSTLYPANRAAAERVSGPDAPGFALLFDPQTSGGLIAAVAADDADRILAALKQDGYRAARIGTVTDGAPRVRVT